MIPSYAMAAARCEPCVCDSSWVPDGALASFLGFWAATFEVALRGFLLGFGACLCKATLARVDKMDEAQDFSRVYKFARQCGAGCACTLVGASMFIPARWRYAAGKMPNQ
eukprot:CAMPEP_0119291546 /NCGR_PEP_ID=MMETSP1329-20130426/42636_1 /TAXON_ID=114041 /ORGANISM="Genus nov. species nov., Strain RCC1024" /LENGTH=109 /DNA_ID=CAMNT_0007292375 /DNA_START=111 /DNA_END=440 /DNA_ORIENTATION=+